MAPFLALFPELSMEKNKNNEKNTEHGKFSFTVYA